MKKWIEVPIIKNAVVVNFGAVMAEWTQNRVKATIHRVVNKRNNHRYSCPQFFSPNLDTILSWDGKEGPKCEDILMKF